MSSNEREKLERDQEAARKAAAEQEKSQFAELQRDKVKAEKRAENLTQLARKLEKELKEERMVSAGLMENIKSMKEKAEKSEKDKTDCMSRIGELEDQVRDVMFFLEARNKIEDGEASEGAGGSLEVHSATPKPKKKKGKKG